MRSHFGNEKGGVTTWSVEPRAPERASGAERRDTLCRLARGLMNESATGRARDGGSRCPRHDHGACSFCSSRRMVLVLVLQKQNCALPLAFRSSDLPVKNLEPYSAATATLQKLLQVKPQLGSPEPSYLRSHSRYSGRTDFRRSLRSCSGGSASGGGLMASSFCSSTASTSSGGKFSCAYLR